MVRMERLTLGGCREEGPLWSVLYLLQINILFHQNILKTCTFAAAEWCLVAVIKKTRTRDIRKHIPRRQFLPSLFENVFSIIFIISTIRFWTIDPEWIPEWLQGNFPKLHPKISRSQLGGHKTWFKSWK